MILNRFEALSFFLTIVHLHNALLLLILQKPTLTAIRAEVKALKALKEAEEAKNKVQEKEPEPEVQQEEPEIKQEHTEAILEENPKEEQPAAVAATTEDDATPTPLKEKTPDGSSEEELKPVDVGNIAPVSNVRKQAMIDRMAAVRGAKKKCGRPPKGKKKAMAAAAVVERTPSPQQEGDGKIAFQCVC